MHPAIEEFKDYWTKLKASAKAPHKTDFSISHLPGRMWKFIDLVEIETDPIRFRYTVFGNTHSDSYGEDLTGKYLDEIDLGGNTETYAAQFNSARVSQVPVFEEDEYLREDGARYRFEGGCFPLLGANGETSHLVLVVATYRNGICYTPW